jgi:hypothetical protein
LSGAAATDAPAAASVPPTANLEAPPSPSAAARGGIRLLHLVDTAVGGEAAILTCKAATDIPGVRHDVWLLGSEKDAALARLVGLHDFQRVTITAGVPESAVRALWRLRAAGSPNRAADASGFDALLAYSPAAVGLGAGVFARPRSFPVIGVMPVSPAAAALGLLPSLAGRRMHHCTRRATIVPLGAALQRTWAAALGLGATAISSPIAGLPHVNSTARARTRAELGIGPDEMAVLLLADPPSGGDARRFAQIVSMARLAGAPVVGLMHAQTDQQARALRFAFVNRRSFEMIRYSGPVTGALAAADVCVWDTPPRVGAGGIGGTPGQMGTASGPVLALAAAAAGIPIIARDELLSREVLEAAARHCLLASDQEHLFAAALLAMADAGVRGAAGAALKAHHTARGKRWRFHAELLDALRIITSSARTTAEWWQTIQAGAVA